MSKTICLICGLEIKWMEGIMIFGGHQPNQEMIEIHKNCAKEATDSPKPVKSNERTTDLPQASSEPEGKPNE